MRKGHGRCSDMYKGDQRHLPRSMTLVICMLSKMVLKIYLLSRNALVAGSTHNPTALYNTSLRHIMLSSPGDVQVVTHSYAAV